MIVLNTIQGFLAIQQLLQLETLRIKSNKTYSFIGSGSSLKRATVKILPKSLQKITVILCPKVSVEISLRWEQLFWSVFIQFNTEVC